MAETDPSHSEPSQPPRRKLWPWVVASVVALLVAIFLTVWVPQEQSEDLLERIEATYMFLHILLPTRQPRTNSMTAQSTF